MVELTVPKRYSSNIAVEYAVQAVNCYLNLVSKKFVIDSLDVPILLTYYEKSVLFR